MHDWFDKLEIQTYHEELEGDFELNYDFVLEG